MYTSINLLTLITFSLTITYGLADLPLGVIEGTIGELGVTFDPLKQTIFYLFTSDLPDPETPEIINIFDAASVLASSFNPDKKTRVLCHGWINNVTSPNIEVLRKAYLLKGDFNIIVVDWYAGARAVYPQAIGYVDPVGKLAADFLNFLSNNAGLSIADVYVVGHSLGAHVAGSIGKYMQRYYNNIIPVIFALDAGLPLYYLADSDQRIDPTDAIYVEGIHTNMPEFGFATKVGHADFYPNLGGPLQPGCVLDTDLFCSHHRSFEFFGESINSDGFVAHKCSALQLLGIAEKPYKSEIMGGQPARTGRSGYYYLNTTGKTPFAKGQFPYSLLPLK